MIVGLSIPLAIAVGILRYGMLDIVLRPVIVYGGLTAVVVAVFVAVSALAGSALERGPLPGVIAAALVAVGLTPARDRVQRGADRFVYGERRDPMRAVVRLGDGVESADPQSLLDVVVASVADAVRAPGASVTGRVGQLLAMHGAVPQTAVTFPLVVAGDSVGAPEGRARRRPPTRPPPPAGTGDPPTRPDRRAVTTARIGSRRSP